MRRKLPTWSSSPHVHTTAADALGLEHRRLRRVRIGTAIGIVGLCVALVVVARTLEARPTTYFSESTGGVVVLDLSSSVDAQKSTRVRRVLQNFSETEGRIGLVVFSDSAYEMLPPDTRSVELTPLIRFFAAQVRPQIRQRGSRGRRGGSAGARPSARIESPWSLSFRGGTRISTGLAEARRVIEREGDSSLSVLLLSDLDNSGFDNSALVEEVQEYRRSGIALRVIPLFPAAEDRELFSGLVGREAILERAELLRNTSVREQQTLIGGFPWILLGLVAALFALVALAERQLARLDWEIA